MTRTFHVLVIALALLLGGCATAPDAPLKNAVAGQAADVASTGLALALVDAAAEGNPLGAGLLVLKPALIWWVDSQPEPERAEALNTVGAVGWAATAHNVCILSIEPATAAACALLGVAVGIWQYHHETAAQKTAREAAP